MSNVIPAKEKLRSCIERIERLNEEIGALNGDKSEVFKEAKSFGLDVKIMRECLKLRQMGSTDRDERDFLISAYMNFLDNDQSGTDVATRARTTPKQTTTIIDGVEVTGRVLITNHPGMPDTIIDGETGEIIEQGSGLDEGGADTPAPLDTPRATVSGEGQYAPVTQSGNDVLGDNPIPDFLDQREKVPA